MKCIRCNNEMIMVGHLVTCLTMNCPIVSFHRGMDDLSYSWIFNFPEFESITVDTGKLNGYPITVIFEKISENSMTKKVFIEFHVEMLDITAEKLKTILVFS